MHLALYDDIDKSIYIIACVCNTYVKNIILVIATNEFVTQGIFLQ